MAKYILLLLSVLMGTFGQILLKLGVNQSAPQIEKIDSPQNIIHAVLIFAKNYYIIVAIVLYGCAFFVWLLTLLKFELSYAFPALAAIYVLVLIFSYIFLNENISILRLSGTLIIAAGILVVLFSNK